MEIDETDRLLGRPAAGPCDPGDRNSDVGPEPRPRAACHRLRRLGRDRPVPREQVRGDPQLPDLDLVCIGHDPAHERGAGARDRRQRRGDEPACAGLRRRQRQPALAAQAKDELGDRGLVFGEEVPPQRSSQHVGEPVGALLRPGLDDEIDVDLEVARADRGLHSVTVAACIRERLRHGGFADPEEAKEAALKRPRSSEERANRLRFERTWPEPLQFRRRSGQDDDDRPLRRQQEPGGRPGKAEHEGTLRDRRLLPHAGLEVRVGTAEPLGEAARDRPDLGVELLVEP